MRRRLDSRLIVWCLADVTAVVAAAAVGAPTAVMRAGVFAVATACLWVIAGLAFGLYDRRWWSRPGLLYVAAAKTWAAVTLVAGLASVLAPSGIIPLRVVLLPLVAAVVGAAVRAGWRAAATRRRKRIVVADAAGEQRLARWLAHYWPEWRIMGILNGRDGAAVQRQAAAHRAAVAYYLDGHSPFPCGDLRPLVLDDELERARGRVSLAPRPCGPGWRSPCDLATHGPGINPPRGRVSLALKRVTDVSLATAGLAALSPLMALLAMLIKLESRGPAIYRQQRLGHDCRPFGMFKFRSMVEQAEQDTGPVWAQLHDPRCTLLGRILRPLHLDELPQLFNVVRGDMSLVGPRPERPELAAELLKTMPLYRTRLAVKPGVTGWAQVNQGYDRDMDDVRRKLEYDLYYVKHQGLLLDAAILLRTIDAVIFGKPRPAA